MPTPTPTPEFFPAGPTDIIDGTLARAKAEWPPAGGDDFDEVDVTVGEGSPIPTQVFDLRGSP